LGILPCTNVSAGSPNIHKLGIATLGNIDANDGIKLGVIGNTYEEHIGNLGNIVKNPLGIGWEHDENTR
jgi:hypothetical protein